jgi:hypothetical protein
MQVHSEVRGLLFPVFTKGGGTVRGMGNSGDTAEYGLIFRYQPPGNERSDFFLHDGGADGLVNFVHIDTPFA